MLHHISIRFDYQHKHQWILTLEEIHKEFTETEFIIYKEFGRVTEKEHYHVHLICPKDVIFVRNRFTRSPHYVEYGNKNDKSWYCRLVRDQKVHLLYVTKDGVCERDLMGSIPHHEFVGRWIPKEDFKGDKLQMLEDYVGDKQADYYNQAIKEWTLRDYDDIQQAVIKMLIIEWHVKSRKTFSKFVIDNYSNLIYSNKVYDKDYNFKNSLKLHQKLNW